MTRQSQAYREDPDNFEFPRYCLDFCFFRAYENGEPAKTPHFLKWNAAGATENELVFTSGHPGRTNRAVTLAQLESPIMGNLSPAISPDHPRLAWIWRQVAHSYIESGGRNHLYGDNSFAR